MTCVPAVNVSSDEAMQERDFIIIIYDFACSTVFPLNLH